MTFGHHGPVAREIPAAPVVAMVRYRSFAVERKRADRQAAQRRKERWQLWSVIALLVAVLVTFYVYSSRRYLAHHHHHQRHAP